MRKNKFNAKMDSRRRSQKERDRAWELKILERKGEIQGLSEQVAFPLNKEEVRHGRHVDVGRCTYIADFTYWQDGRFVVEDVKGYKGSEAYRHFRTKKAWMYQLYGIVIKET